MVDLNAHEAGNGGKKPRAAYSLPSLLYSERLQSGNQADISSWLPSHGSYRGHCRSGSARCCSLPWTYDEHSGH